MQCFELQYAAYSCSKASTSLPRMYHADFMKRKYASSSSGFSSSYGPTKSRKGTIMRLRCTNGTKVFFVLAVVVLLVVALGGEGEADGTRGEVINLTPEHGRQVEAVIGTIQMKALLVFAVVHDHIEAAG